MLYGILVMANNKRVRPILYSQNLESIKSIYYGFYSTLEDCKLVKILSFDEDKQLITDYNNVEILS